MKHETSTFLCGCAPFYDFLFFAKELDDLVAKGTPNSSFFCFDETEPTDKYCKYDESVGWPAIAIATIKPENGSREVVAIGPNGNYWELEPLSTEETIGKIPDFQGNLRTLSVITDSIFACGMGRVVFERKSKGQWISIGPSLSANDADVVGFEDIDGFSKTEIYAVGWGGEIWWRDDSTWRKIDSPVSGNLNALCCADDGIVYIIGDNGAMLKGRHDVWSVIDTERMENLMDVAFYKGNIYVTTDFRILKLEDDKLVNETSFVNPGDTPSTCLHLLSASDGLISLGTKDVFRLHNDQWERLV